MNEDINAAIIDGNAEKLNNIIKGNKNIDYYDNNHLHTAVSTDNSEIIEILLNKGADANQVNLWYLNDFGTREVTPLFLAIRNENIESVKKLIKYGADVNFSIEGIYLTPLSYAVFLNNLTIAKILVESKAEKLSFNDKLFTSDENTIIENIIENNDSFKFGKLINYGIAYFIDLSSINKDIVKFIKSSIEHIDLSDENISTFIAKLFTKKYNTEQGGRMPISQEILLRRDYRNFTNDRERQILRHFATQIYLCLKDKNNPNITEVQVMYLVSGAGYNIFISGNEYIETNKFIPFLENNNLKEILTTPYSNRKNEDGFRTRRYAYKLNERIFKGDINFFSTDNQQKIKEIIANGKITPLTVEYTKSKKLELSLNRASKKRLTEIFKSSGKIFFIQPQNLKQKYNTRHAEEFLCDIADYAKTFIKNEEVYASIAGKKRPCIGCLGRINHLETKGITMKNNQYPGLFWLGTIKTQPDFVAQKTMNIIINNKSYVSRSKNKKTISTNYDSGSDSISDSDLTLSNEEIKMK